jgi:hypothetical protein
MRKDGNQQLRNTTLASPTTPRDTKWSTYGIITDAFSTPFSSARAATSRVRDQEKQAKVISAHPTRSIASSQYFSAQYRRAIKTLSTSTINPATK